MNNNNNDNEKFCTKCLELKNNNPDKFKSVVGKYDVRWLSVTHDCSDLQANKDSLWQALVEYGNEVRLCKRCLGFSSQVWFKQEAPIVTLCARNIDAAHAMAKVCKIAGVKRSAITSLQEKIILSIADTKKVETLVALDGNILPTKAYFDVMVETAQQKLEAGREKLFDQFTAEFLKRLPHSVNQPTHTD